MEGEAVGRRVWLLGAVLAALLAAPAPARATFRFDEIDRRDFEYNTDYFINVYSYRPRLTFRWSYLRAAVGYRITAGSVRADELYIDQRARLRLAMSNDLTGQLDYVQAEDFDARFERGEVEVLVRALRPPGARPLLAGPGRTPPPDGLFFGGRGHLLPRKAFTDAGVVLGYANRYLTVRGDVLFVDPFFDKNDLGAAYDDVPVTLRGRVEGRLLQGDLRVAGWAGYDEPLALTFEAPVRDGLRFRYHQARAGLEVRWSVAYDLRMDLVAWGELTDKTRRSATSAPSNQDFEREAVRAVYQVEKDVAPLLGSHASRPFDVVFGGLFVQWLDEDTDALQVPGGDITIRRGEVYAELGYVLSIPSIPPQADQYELGVRISTQLGFLSERDVRPAEARHEVNERFLMKAGLGWEVGFRDDLSSFFGQFTFRLDDAAFGGGNVQVLVRF